MGASSFISAPTILEFFAAILILLLVVIFYFVSR